MSEIKNIILSGNYENSENNGDNGNNENIIFGLSNNEANNSEKFILNNENIVVEEVVNKVDNKSDDIIYLREIENQLLSEYPVSKQGYLYIQKEVQQEANRIIDIKNIGVKNYDMFQNGIDYFLTNDVINDKFNSKWIIPIVLDKHKIYTRLKDDEKEQVDGQNNLEESNIYFSESLENKDGIIEENQRIQMANLKKIFHEYSLSKINVKTYLNDTYNITRPYEPKYSVNMDNNVGYVRKPKDSTLVLRYYDHNNILWNDRMTVQDYLVGYDVKDEKTKKIVGIKENILINGDEINIVGFLILPNAGKGRGPNLGFNLNPTLNKDKDFDKHFEEVGIITNIYQAGTAINIDIKNHGLADGDIILIEESNSFPSINNVYSKSIKVVNNDVIAILSNKKIVVAGTFGKLFVLSKLKYDAYFLNPQDNNFIFAESTYSDKKEDVYHNKIYLFDKTLIKSKRHYDDLVKKIIPDIEKIVNSEMDEIRNSYTFGDINNILKKYQIGIDNINIKQIALIKDILKENLDKFINQKITKINLIIGSKVQNYFLSDEFITNKNIEKFYGIYRYLNKPEDNVILRLKWIQYQKDYGNLYYQEILLDKYKKYNPISDIKDIKDKISELEKMLAELEKNSKKEKNQTCKLYKFQPYIVDKKNPSDIPNNSTVFYENNIYWWKNNKMEEMENLEERTMALVGENIWIWEKGVWGKSDSSPQYNNIKYLCEFNNIDLKNLDLDAMDCIYRKEVGCSSKISVRLNDLTKKITENIENLQNLVDYLSNNKYMNNILTNIDVIQHKYFFNARTKEIKIGDAYTDSLEDDSDTNKEPKFPINIFVNNIMNVQNDYIKLNLLYDLIDKDGILIGQDIYSKKYEVKIMCGHYLYFKKIEQSNGANEKTEAIQNMLNIFSDFGESQKSVNTCKNCGQVLLMADYDETEGFSDSGMIKKSRETWIAETMKDDDNSLNILNFFKDSKIDCSSELFKKKLLKNGLSYDDSDQAIKICEFITKNLYLKTGVSLPSDVLINVIIDSMQKIKVFPPYSVYKIKEIKKYEEKGYEKRDIEKFDIKFREEYETIKNIRVNTIICARFLIAVQTVIPTIVRQSYVEDECAFISFDGREGFEYMSCILVGLTQSQSASHIKKTDVFENFFKKLEEAYNEFKSISYIRELFKSKKAYDTQFKKKLVQIQDIKPTVTIDLIEPSAINKDFLSRLMNNKDINSVRTMFADLFKRLIFLAKKIKLSVKDVIATEPYADNSCCLEDVNDYLGYYFYIAAKTEYPLKEIIDESIESYGLLKYFIKSGVIHRFVLVNKDKFDGIRNPIIVDNDETTSESIIKDMFENFVDTGYYVGTRRDYLQTINGYIDIKTGLSKKDIMSKKYSIQEYQTLLKNIENNNIKYFKEPWHFSFDAEYIQNLKKTSNEKLLNIIKILVSNIAQILNKDQVFIDNYTNILLKFGQYNKNKVEYLKTFYVSNMKKKLSIIKNNFDKLDIDDDLNFIGKTSTDETMKLEIQSDIYNENKKMSYFLTNEIRQNFLGLTLNYTNQEINSITGNDTKKSDFTSYDAYNVLMYIIVSNLNDWVLCKTTMAKINMMDMLNMNLYEEKQVINTINSKAIKCKYVCDFIIMLLDEQYEDYELFEKCKVGAEGIKNSIINEIITEKARLFLKGDEDDYFTSSMKSKLGKKTFLVSELEENIKKDGEKDIIADIDLQNKIDFIMEKGKKYMSDQLGHKPTEDELEEFKNNYMESMYEDEALDDENYDLMGGPKGAEVLDQGADYGNLNEYDFEDGDGFDYSDQMTDE